MLPITIAGTWAATQPTVASRRWVRTAPDLTAHYFLVVSHGPHGTTAFVRNPEANAGAFLGTRDVSLVGTHLRLKRRGRPDVAGALNADGTLTLNQVAIDGANVRFHRATARDLRWFYPAASSTWTYHKPVPLSDGWRVATFGDVGMRPGPIAPIMNAVLSQRSPRTFTKVDRKSTLPVKCRLYNAVAPLQESHLIPNAIVTSAATQNVPPMAT